jgi:hypothetical protein
MVQRVPARQVTPQPPQLRTSERVSTQASLQHAVPTAQAGPRPHPGSPTHAPRAQVCPARHTTPHAPQCWGSLSTSRQAAPQHWVPPVHDGPPPQPMTVWQRPAKQVCPAAQRTPQALQFSGSTATFTQVPLQQVEPGEQAGPMPQPSGRTHAPARHTVPATHATPQPPQLRASSPVDTHAPPQHACPAAHAGPAPQPALMQRPSEQVCPVRHATPQPPQLKGSAWVETQRSPQQTVGRPQVGMPPQPIVNVQRPATHCCPSAQATPHAPQLVGSLCALTQRSPQHVAPGTHAGPPPQVGIT